MIYLVAKHPEVEKKLREEIDALNEGGYSYENLKKYRYIECIQKETTRYFGPVNYIFSREVAKDHYLKGVAIKKGTKMNVPIASHFKTEYFKDPYTFRPERWEGETDELPPFVHMGFSGGPRTCIGKHLALL